MSKKLLITAIGLIASSIIFFVVFLSIPSSYKNTINVSTHKVNAFNSKTKIAKIVVFSDLHLLYDYQASDLDKLVAKINEQNPDLVIFNGDLFHNKSYKRNKSTNSKIIKSLQKIQPIYGKFAILGEQDIKNRDSQIILFNSDFEVLTNSLRNIKINSKSFNLIGLINNDKHEYVLNNVSDTSYNFLLTHNPEIIDSITKYKIDLIVTGHTLGGQYNLPFYGSIFKNIRDIPYYKGYNLVNDVAVYNSNGIGVYNSSMRFLAPSAFEVFNIY